MHWDTGPPLASAAVSPILPWTDSPDSESVTANCILASLPNGSVQWPLPGTVQQQAGANLNQLEVFLTGTALTRQGFGECYHNPAQDRDLRLYNGPPALWPSPVAAARYCATAAGAAQLEVFLTGTAALDRDS